MYLSLALSALLKAPWPNPAPLSSSRNFLTCFQVLRCRDPVYSVNDNQNSFGSPLVCVFRSCFILKILKRTGVCSYQWAHTPRRSGVFETTGGADLYVLLFLCTRACGNCSVWSRHSTYQQ